MKKIFQVSLFQLLFLNIFFPMEQLENNRQKNQQQDKQKQNDFSGIMDKGNNKKGNVYTEVFKKYKINFSDIETIDNQKFFNEQ